MSTRHTEKCGCILDASERYIKMCQAHETEFRATHDRWTADYRKDHPLGSTNGGGTDNG